MGALAEVRGCKRGEAFNDRLVSQCPRHYGDAFCQLASSVRVRLVRAQSWLFVRTQAALVALLFPTVSWGEFISHPPSLSLFIALAAYSLLRAETRSLPGVACLFCHCLCTAFLLELDHVHARLCFAMCALISISALCSFAARTEPRSLPGDACLFYYCSRAVFSLLELSHVCPLCDVCFISHHCSVQLRCHGRFPATDILSSLLLPTRCSS
jgi:hypothetical protein